MKTTVRLLLLVFVLPFLSACDSTELIPGNERLPQREGPPPVITPLWYEFYQRTTPEATVEPVGRVAIETFTNPVNLGTLKRTVLDFDAASFTIQVFSEEWEDKDLVVFWVLHNEKPNERGHVRRPSLNVSSLGEGMAGKGASVIVPELEGQDGVFYGFFLEGIGDSPSKPVHFTIGTDKDTYEIEVDPVSDKLPLQYVYEATAPDFDLLHPADDYLEIKSRNQFANDATALQPVLLFRALASEKQGPRLEWRQMDAWAPSASWSASGLTLTDELQLYVIMLEGL